MIQRLAELGALPSEAEASDKRFGKVEALLRSVVRPVSDEEARALVPLFRKDSCNGLAWTVIHLVETAPGWPLADCLVDQSSEWHALLRTRAVRP